MKSFFIFLLAFSVSFYSLAGGFIKGNGGNVLSCPSLKKTMVLDAYEQTARFGLYPDLNLLKSEKFYELLLQKANKISPLFSQSLKKSLEQVLANILILDHINLGPIDDSYPFFIPNQCEIKLAALQRNGKVLVSAVYWNQLTQDQKFFLILHEALYLNALKQNPLIDDSEPIRILNALLLSQELQTWGTRELQLFLKKFHLLN